jgi:hypothetical protein
VEDVVRFRRFDPGALRPEHLAYVLFGDGAEAHMDHHISRDPDFQHVMTLPAVPPWVSKEQLQKGVEVVFPVSSSSVRCEAPLRDATYPVTVAGAPRALSVGAAATVWFSTGNLLNAKDPCAPGNPG